jgi:hypothetical protein
MREARIHPETGKRVYSDSPEYQVAILLNVEQGLRDIYAKLEDVESRVQNLEVRLMAATR